MYGKRGFVLASFVDIVKQTIIPVVLLLIAMQYVNSLESNVYYEGKAIAQDVSTLISTLSMIPYPTTISYRPFDGTDLSRFTFTFSNDKADVSGQTRGILYPKGMHFSGEHKEQDAWSFRVSGMTLDTNNEVGSTLVQRCVMPSEHILVKPMQGTSKTAADAQLLKTLLDATRKETEIDTPVTITRETNEAWPDNTVLVHVPANDYVVAASCMGFNRMVANIPFAAGTVYPGAQEVHIHFINSKEINLKQAVQFFGEGIQEYNRWGQ